MKSVVGMFAVAAFLMVSSSVAARTWYIKADGTGDAPTIQAGVDSAAVGDTVLVECGTYYEHDILMKSGVCLKSEADSPKCITIDAQLQGSVIICNTNDSSTKIECITMTNASEGAMRISHSYVVVNNCTMKNNEGANGTAVDIWQSAPQFNNCLFYANQSTHAPFAWTVMIAIGTDIPTFSNCTFAENSAGIGFVYDAAAYIDNCIIAFCTDGPAVGGDEGAYPILSCSNLFGNVGDDWICQDNCFSTDPEFCGVFGTGNYYLQSDSPCAPGNHPDGVDCGLIGALPVECGTVATKKSTWGSMKSRFREEGE